MKRTSAALLAICALGLVLRLMGMRGDLWLDEILSLQAVRQMGSIAEVFSRHHDNNHLLTSAWLYVVRDASAAWIARAPSVLLGLGSMLLLACWQRNDSRRISVFLAVLFSLSYIFVLYDSEARGYAAMLFGGLLAWWALEAHLRNGQIRWLVLFWSGCAISMLGHLSGLQWYVTIALWSALDSLFNSRETLQARSRNLCIIHLPVVIGIFFLWSFFASQLPPGSGTLRSWVEVAISAFSIGYGGPVLSLAKPEIGILAILWAIAAVLLLGKACCSLYRTDRARALALFVGIFVVPLLTIVAFEPRVLYERYFLPSYAFGYFALAYYLDARWASGAIGRRLALLLLLVFIAGNACNIAALFTSMRGEYARPLVAAAQASDRSEATISSNQEFRTRTLLDFFKAELPAATQMRFVVRPEEAQWYFFQVQDQWWEPSPEICPTPTKCFFLVSCARSAPLSGWSWCAYRDVPPQAG